MDKSYLLHNRYFEGIIIKCDKLITGNMQDGYAGLDENYAALFSNRSANSFVKGMADEFDFDTIVSRSFTIRNNIEERQFFGEEGIAGSKSLESLEAAYGDKNDAAKRKHDPVTWSFVSATGCLTTKESAEAPGKLKDKYKPIRIADPLADCIVKHIADLGWI